MPQIVAEPLRSSGNQKGRIFTQSRMSLHPMDRVAVLTGAKTQVRHWVKVRRRNERRPGPMVVYTERADGKFETAVIWCENFWYEQVGAISETSLAAEGFVSYEQFITYLRAKWPTMTISPLHTVRVSEVRPITLEDQQRWMTNAWDRLYGNYA